MWAEWLQLSDCWKYEIVMMSPGKIGFPTVLLDFILAFLEKSGNKKKDCKVGAVDGLLTAVQRVGGSIPTRSNSRATQSTGSHVYVNLNVCKRTHDTGENNTRL
ncbi:hypothetical protein SFRURICE_008784 [Spodoptera frugiperda]|nr:hypothetical protein SFRURICE_008784 [Spodoptera frugiperda]